MAFTTSMTVTGNLTRDPEVRFTQSGQAVASFTVASTPRTYDRDSKEYKDGEAIFTNCVIWGKPAEHFGASAQKGTRVIAVGALKSRSYEDREGNQKSSTELVVEELGLSVTFAEVTARRGTPTGQKPVANDSWGAVNDDDTPF